MGKNEDKGTRDPIWHWTVCIKLPSPVISGKPGEVLQVGDEHRVAFAPLTACRGPEAWLSGLSSAMLGTGPGWPSGLSL